MYAIPYGMINNKLEIRQMKNIFFCIFIIISLLSCTKEIPLKTKDFNTILIVNSIICPDSVFKVHVSKSIAVTSTENREINTAKVSLFANGIFVDSLLSKGNGIYSLWVTPEIEKKYELKVEADGFKDISAIETIPGPATIIDFSYTPNTGYDYNDQSDLNDLCITFNDDGNRNNYYEMLFYTSYSGKGKLYYPNYWIRFDNLILNNEGDIDYEPTSIFFSDELFNGKKCYFPIKVMGPELGPNYTIYAILRTTTYNYYKYRKLWTRHRHNQNEGIDSYQDIFRGEPLEMFTNVTNGNGIFAGYTQDVKQATIIK